MREGRLLQSRISGTRGRQVRKLRARRKPLTFSSENWEKSAGTDPRAGHRRHSVYHRL
ncbi:hypothetical protein OCO_31810 [Mycobacterium intracellulare MOTT-02]|uniref:Uncharacterized protein n=1 Tax=Mycobacterium indicus pranii (strain DSM 45239 / MTCC 9506) TaxID=1232724 RepID=J9WGD5_MYCIP|nr:hypothetical protein OCO_31810 [Mycobacterium intracellulare MOTT-02]AFC54801.1 hypothetical protein OCQ_32890 [Mycobacterium paraintracellulare]AFS15228.1 Hypothetical protein MIP_04770 [Mycobacterium intracellulare subsp. intracellulare MTCC 9506]AGP64676.1 hypothetical protein OEM_31410 [Mycobacterium intracellulare subsp. yongonense 05-1390]ARR78807.1 hypothetical protein MOTT12_03143 [Mycobacterium intracellulare subsp. yongonense]ETZ28333.1 hypothetical protein L842_3356 [Mycobacteriu